MVDRVLESTRRPPAEEPEPIRGRRIKRRWIGLVLSLVVAAGVLIAVSRDDSESIPATGYWTTPLAEDAPVDGSSDAYLEHIQAHSETDYIRLAGATDDGKWGNPIYRAEPDDPVYAVQNTCDYRQPPEFSSVRIPTSARPDPSSDSAMTLYDLDKEIVYGFYRARYEESADRWSACGGAVYYLGSNGLVGSLEESDEPRNYGHRGVPPFAFAVEYDEVREGRIDHVLKIAVNLAGKSHVFPMTGSDGDSDDEFAPPEGMRIRLKPSLELEAMDLSHAEQTIAEALQTYGAVIGDQSGTTTVLKLENTVAQGSGQLWEGVLEPDSLSMFSFDDFEVIRLGYRS